VLTGLAAEAVAEGFGLGCGRDCTAAVVAVLGAWAGAGGCAETAGATTVAEADALGVAGVATGAGSDGAGMLGDTFAGDGGGAGALTRCPRVATKPIKTAATAAKSPPPTIHRGIVERRAGAASPGVANVAFVCAMPDATAATSGAGA
jgi:hypothetical protein